MKLPAHEYLDKLGLPYETAEFPDTTEKGAANVAKALGYRERQMVKTLIFQTDRGDHALVMVGGDQNVVSGHLKKVLGSRNIAMAKPETVIEVTGYKIGSLPPFHWQKEGVRTLLDESLVEEEILGVGTGAWGYEILIRPGDLIAAAKAEVVNLTDKEKPIFPNLPPLPS
jgi:Cys-tRNA(Pro)/Cys-tRNA(Cys) deacylase